MTMHKRTIVISGTSGGLGNSVMQYYLRAGAKVIAIDREIPDITLDGVSYITVDLATQSGIELATKEIESSCNGIDLLVNCAGIFEVDGSLSDGWETFDKLWRCNTLSSVMLTLHLERLLTKTKSPAVVNIASTDGVVASSGQQCEVGVSHDLYYSITKGAIVTFTRALAMKWAPIGVRVFALCPTLFDSPMTNSLLDIPGKAEELKSHIPIGRLCTVDDIVTAIESAYSLKMTTAHMIPVDGGYLCQ